MKINNVINNVCRGCYSEDWDNPIFGDRIIFVRYSPRHKWHIIFVYRRTVCGRRWERLAI